MKINPTSAFSTRILPAWITLQTRGQLRSRSRHALTLGLTSLLFVQPVFALGTPLPTLPGSPKLPSAAEVPAAPDVPGFSSSLGNSLPDAPMPEAEALTIEILDGEGALNNIRQRTAREPIVQVEDKNHKPVAGALVLFAIQSGPSGAGGSVAGATTFSVRTGADGKAQLHGLKPNNISGDFTITVTATAGVMVAAAVIIHQKNESGGPAEHATNHHYIVKGTIIGGVVLTGVILGIVLTHTNGGASITAGNGTVTPP